MPTSSMLNLDVPDVVLLNIHVKPNASNGGGGTAAVNSSEFGKDIESDGQSSVDTLPITVCFRIVDERTVDEQQLPAAPKMAPSSLPGVPEDDNEDEGDEGEDEEDDDDDDNDDGGGGGDDSNPAGGEGKTSDGTSLNLNGRVGTTPDAGEQRETGKRPAVSAGDALAAYLRGDITLKALQKIQDELGLGNEKEPNGNDASVNAASSATGAPPSATTRRTLRKMLDEMDAGEDDDNKSDDVSRSKAAHYYVKLLRGLESNHPRAPRESSALGAHRGEAFDTQNPVKYFYEDPDTGKDGAWLLKRYAIDAVCVLHCRSTNLLVCLLIPVRICTSLHVFIVQELAR